MLDCSPESNVGQSAERIRNTANLGQSTIIPQAKDISKIDIRSARWVLVIEKEVRRP